MTSQQAIDRELDHREMKSRTWLVGLGLIFLAFVLAFCASAYAQAANTATITFSPSTQYTDGTAYPSGAVVSYNLWQGLKGASRVKVGTVTSGGSITTGLLTGNEYCWDVTTVVTIGGSATESAHSLEACKRFDGKPSVVVITVT
jgi:hypothetical protein